MELSLIVSRWFQVLFHGAFRPSFHLSLTVLVHYRSCLMFSLGVWSPQLQKGVCRLPTYSGTCYASLGFRIRGYHALWPPIPRCSTNLKNPMAQALQPRPKGRFGLFPFRSSLTQGISFDFFSCAYLDISVQHVPLRRINRRIPHITARGVSPFGHRRITAFWELPDDFRALGVLLRSNKPRHPPSALSYKIYIIEMFSYSVILSNNLSSLIKEQFL